jgi:hypothetical protein
MVRGMLVSGGLSFRQIRPSAAICALVIVVCSLVTVGTVLQAASVAAETIAPRMMLERIFIPVFVGVTVAHSLEVEAPAVEDDVAS